MSALAVPQTALLATDRLAVRIYVNNSGRTIKLHTEDNHLCQVITTFSTGITALNGLTDQVQNFAVGTSGTDFAINSATATHTFNLPTASAVNRGALSSADWSTFDGKQNALGFTPENVANKSDSFTASSTTTYANTKALVDGLATKQNTIIIASNYTNVGLTATTAETILHALLIPANTFGVGRDPKFSCIATKTGTANFVTMRARIATSAAPSPVTSGTLIATLVPASGGVLWYPFERRGIHIDTATSTLSTNVSSVAHTDYFNAASNTVLNNNIDWTVNQYLIITGQPASSNADVFTLNKTEIYL